MTDGTPDRESAHTSALSDRTEVGKTTKLRRPLREMYENADFDGTFVEWVRERSKPSEDGDADWVDPKTDAGDTNIDENGESA